jgi:predicted nucleic acid-binding protein
MLVVTDTSPLNYLVWIQQDTLLPILYDRVVIPPAVYEELQRPETPPLNLSEFVARKHWPRS